MRCRRGIVLAAAVILTAVLVVFPVLAAVWPEAPGDSVKKDGDLKADISNASQGYITVFGPTTERRLKVRVTRDDTVFTYDLNGAGTGEVFPLQMGSGTYMVSLYKNVEGKSYSQEGQVSFKAELGDEAAAYLCPNQYVYYTQDSGAVMKAEELCGSLTDEQEIFDTIREHIMRSYGYDFIKAVTVQSGVLPDVDGTFVSHMGICQDLSALACCMLRVCGVHARLVIGYADGNYHAWVSVTVDGNESLYDPTADLNAVAKPTEYIEERWY